VVLGRWNAPALRELQSVTVSGDFAYLIAEENLHIVSVADPAFPNLVGTYVDSVRIEDAVVSGRYAYLVSKGAGLQVIDVGNPANPVRVGGLAGGAGGARAIAVEAGLAFLVDGGELEVINVVSPVSPTRVGQCSLSDRDIDFASFTHVVASGDYLYLSGDEHESVEGWMAVVNVGQPVAPWELVVYTPRPRLGLDFPWFRSGVLNATVADSTVFAVGYWELPADGTYDFEYYGLEAIDVTFPGDPQMLGRYVTHTPVNAVAVSGRYAYLATDAGVLVIDARDPTNLERVGANHEFPAEAIAVAGDKLYAVGQHGFFILQAPAGPALLRPSFAAPIQMSRNGAKLTVDGPAGQTAYIQRTTDLARWENWLSVTLPGQPVEVTDEEAVTRGRQFYRLMLR